MHTPAAGEVSFGDERELHAGQQDPPVEGRDDDVHARARDAGTGVVDHADTVDGDALTDEELFDPVGGTAALRGDDTTR